MDIFIENNILSDLNKIKLAVFFPEYSYILKKSKFNTSSVEVVISVYFGEKHNTKVYIEYDVSIKKYDLYELFTIYYQEYESVLNIIKLLSTDKITEYNIEVESYKNWKIKILYLPPDDFLNIIKNCYLHKLNLNLDIKSCDIQILYYLDNSSELTLDMFDSRAICSNPVMNKIREQYDIVFFSRDFVSCNSLIFSKIYSEDVTEQYYLSDSDYESEDDFESKIIPSQKTVSLCDVLANPNNYIYLDHNIKFKYNDDDELDLHNQSHFIEIYHIIKEGNYNIVYLYDKYGDLQIMEKIRISNVGQEPNLTNYELDFDEIEWIYNLEFLFYGIENRTDIIRHIVTNKYFIKYDRLCIGSNLSSLVFEYFLDKMIKK